MASKKMFHISVEGSVGVGKSTFLKKFKNHFENELNFTLLSEPVDVWTNYGKNKYNLLEMMYQNIPGAPMAFQSMALLTKLKQLQNTQNVILSERSILAQKNVFLPLLLKNNKISPLENELLIDWIDTLSPHFNLKPDFTVYLQCTAENSMNRILARGRLEERDITLGYLNPFAPAKKIVSEFDETFTTS